MKTNAESGRTLSQNRPATQAQTPAVSHPISCRNRRLYSDLPYLSGGERTDTELMWFICHIVDKYAGALRYAILPRLKNLQQRVELAQAVSLAEAVCAADKTWDNPEANRRYFPLASAGLAGLRGMDAGDVLYYICSPLYYVREHVQAVLITSTISTPQEASLWSEVLVVCQDELGRAGEIDTDKLPRKAGRIYNKLQRLTDLEYDAEVRALAALGCNFSKGAN